MKKSILGFSVLATALSMSMTSCQNEEFASVASGDEFENIHVIATVSRAPESRTSKPMTGNGLECSWEENDKVVVFSKNGEDNLGVLTLETGAGEKDATFSGTLRVRPSDTDVNIYYLGRNKTEGLDNLMIDETFHINLQNGANSSITDYDIMYSAAEMKRLSDGSASLNFGLNSIVSFAHFYAHLPEGVVPANSEAITVSGQNVFNQFTLKFANAEITNTVAGPITVNPVWETGATNEFDFFMAVLPGENVQTDFTITIGEKTYRASLDARTYNANKIFSGGKIEGKDVYFSENDTWTVTYMNGEEVVKTETANSFAPSMTFTAIAGPEKEAFNFLGWAEAENGAVVYTAGQEFTLNRPETEKTLYAVWEAAKAENMTVYGWYNDGTELKVEDVEYNHTWPFTFDLSNLDIPTRDEYTFKGWAASADSKTAITSVTFNYPETVKNVYAIWEASKVDVTVKGMDDDKYLGSGTDKGVKLPHTMILSENLEAPTKDGYTFLGWTATKGGSEIITEVTFTNKDELTKTVYAVWKKNSSEGTITAPGSTGTGY